MVNNYEVQVQLLKQLLNTLLTHNCVEFKPTPSISTEEMIECIKKMKKFPTLSDIIEKRGEDNANTQRDTEPSKDIQTKGCK